MSTATSPIVNQTTRSRVSSPTHIRTERIKDGQPLPYAQSLAKDLEALSKLLNSITDELAGNPPVAITAKRLTVLNRAGFGIPAPVAWVDIRAGNVTTPPLRIAKGTVTTNPIDGCLEYDGVHLYFTVGSTRHVII